MSELNVQTYLRSGKTLTDLESELGIKAGEWGDLVVLNYNQIDSPKTHPIVMECRQLVLEKSTWGVVHMSFRRFFNYGEALDLVQNFDYKNAVALDKLDGSIIGVFFYKNQWLMTTRGVIEGNCQVGAFPLTFKQLFEQTVSQYPNFWSELEYTRKKGYNLDYTFELTAPENRVVTPYMERSLHLLTIRDADHDFCELGPVHVQRMASMLGVKIPQSHSFKNIEELVQMAANVEGLNEGFVCIDYSVQENGTYRRMKVKNPAYLAVAHLKESSASSLRSLLQLVIMGEANEFLAYFPEYKSYVEGLKTEWDKYRSRLVSELGMAKEKKSLPRKDYALWAKTCINSNVMFQYLDGKITTVQDWVDLNIKEKGAKNFGKMMMQVLKIKDIEWTGQL